MPRGAESGVEWSRVRGKDRLEKGAVESPTQAGTKNVTTAKLCCRSVSHHELVRVYWMRCNYEGR